MNKGKVSQIIGVVVDVRFSEGELPSIYEALTIEFNDRKLVLEVQQHLNQDTVRAVALGRVDGLKRNTEVNRTGNTVQVPVGKENLGRMFNMLGEPIDNLAQVKASEKSSIHRSAPKFDKLST